MGEEQITTWDAASDYIIGGVAGAAAFLLGFSRTTAVLIAGSMFLAWAMGRHFFQRWRDTNGGQQPKDD